MLVGAVEARESRGFVQVYVRRGMSCDRLQVEGPHPCVVVRVGRAEALAESFVVAAVHLPTDAANAGVRERVLRKMLATSGDEDKLLIVGDMNARDEEIKELCKGLGVQEARYAGVSWGAPGNRFY